MSQSPDTRKLSILETRILGVLIEKEKTTPDTYPLTLHGLTAGCNQKSAREPMLSVSESEVQTALEDLRSRVLVLETYGASGRVLRYAHNFGRVYGVPAASVALLAVLALRGPQTASELRANTERLYRFDDTSSAEAYLEELAARDGGALVKRLPKQSGNREQRWTHLLCEPAAAQPEEGAAPPGSTNETAELRDRVARLELDVAELQATLKELIGKAISPR